MKKMLLLAAMATALVTSSFSSDAQVRVNINVGAPVARQSWYGVDDDYFYMPDQGVYYNVARRVYVYPDRGGWAYASYLPQRYGSCSFQNSRYYRVRARAPFERNDYYQRQYAYNYGRNNGWNNGRHDRWDDDRRDGRRFDNDRENNHRRDNGFNNGYDNRRR